MNNLLIKRRIKEKIQVSIIRILILVLFLVLWEVSSRLKIIDSFLFSSPSKILVLMYQYFASAEIFKHIGISLIETMLGLLIGTVLGIVIAIILWWNKKIARIIDPFLVVLNALPKTALAPLLIIWVGTNIIGITVVAISISLILTIISCYNYFEQVEEEKIKMLWSLGANKLQILFKLIIPSNFLNIISIIKINIGMSWVGVIVGEFIVSKAGIGYLILYGTQVFKMDLVMMGVLVLAIISYVMYEIVNLIIKKIRRKLND